MRIALVHDWIIYEGGAERVLQSLHRLWPDAPIFTLLYQPETVRRLLPNATIRPSRLQRLPGAWRYYPLLAPLMPSAIETFDFSAFDTVISSSVVFSKGIIVRPDTRHLSYCYSPTRSIWDRAHRYQRTGILSHVYRHLLRSWDLAAAQRPDHLLAISNTTAARITKYYHRSSIVVPPPMRAHATPDYTRVPADAYYLVVGRLIAHKDLEIVIDAFAKLRCRLVIVGEGTLFRQLQRRSQTNIVFVGRVTDAQLDGLYDRCTALIVPNEEDWGLTAVEAMSHGKPVLALRRGGATETVLEGITGEFFDDAIPEAIADGVKRITAGLSSYDASHITNHASQYGEEQFARRMKAIVELPS